MTSDSIRESVVGGGLLSHSNHLLPHCRLAALACEASAAFIIVMEPGGALLAAAVGLESFEGEATVLEVFDRLGASFTEVIAIANAASDPRLADVAVQSEFAPGFLALAPVVLCRAREPQAYVGVMDLLPRGTTAKVVEALRLIARQVADSMELARRRANDEHLWLLEASMAHTNDIVIITEADPMDEPGPRIVYVNEAFVRRTGYEPDEALGRNPRFLQGPRTQRDALDKVRTAMASQEAVCVEIINYTKSGEEFWLEMDVVPVKDAAGKCTHFIAVERDITNRKLAEEKQLLIEGESRAALDLLRAVTEGTPDAVFVKDRQGRYLLFNEGAALAVGKPVDEVLGRDDSAIFAPEDARQIMDNDRQVMESGKVHTVEEVLLTSAGPRIFLATKAPYRDGSGNIIGMVGISRDITERQRADEKLREQGTLLDQARDAIVVRDLDHRILYWNQGAEQTYGWTAEEAVGRSIKDLIYRDATSFTKAVEETLEHDEWTGSLKQEHKSGRTLEVECRWALVRDKQGRPKSILAINTDVTEKKKLEQMVLRAQRMESIGTLAGGIAHDLNNVLVPIGMSIELLKMEEKDPDRLDLLTIMEQSTQRGARMVKQVLSFARGVEGEAVVMQLGPVVREVQKIVEETFPKNIRSRFTQPEDLWPVIGDATQLHQVLLNLCVNARDAMPKGGDLKVRTSNLLREDHAFCESLDNPSDFYVLLEVEDTGTGMPPEVVDRIFEPFFTTKEQGKGTGLGLSTTAAIIKSHHGSIKVYSEVGVGTKFSCYLPARAEDTAQEPVKAVEHLPRGNGETILVVDDDAPVRDVTRQTLETHGYKVMLACDGEEGLATYAAKRREIDLVLTDMMMPVMDGPALIQALNRISPELPIVATSGLSANGPAATEKLPFLPKPYTSAALLQTLHEALSGPATGK